MAWLHQDCVVQELSENVLLYDLAQMRSSDALLIRIPENVSGIYAWYRRFEFDPVAKENPEVFVSLLLDELYKPHCHPRVAKLPPSSQLILQAETSFSKQAALKQLAQDGSFRETVLALLENSILFQQPLYIGKANNLKKRIRTHLCENSILRERLKKASHNLDRCRLLVIIIKTDISETEFFHEPQLDDNLSIDCTDVDDEAEIDFPLLEKEELIEDILSRLFLPSFSIRYG